MHFADYAPRDAAPTFAKYTSGLRRRDSVIAGLDVDAVDVSVLEKLPMGAVRNASRAAGRFPLVFLVGGLNAETTAEAVLAEYLASHGFIVATVPWTGLDEEHLDAVRNAQGIEAVTRDVEFAWARLRTLPGVDASRVGIAGHSLGGIIAVIEAMRNGDVTAAAGLDATYGIPGGTSVLTDFYGYSPRRMTAAVLDLRKAAGEQNTTPDLAAVDTWYYADRTFVLIPHIRHSEFTTYSLLAHVLHEPAIPPQFQSPGWTRATAARGYLAACRILLDFFEVTVRGDSANGVTRLAKDVAASVGATMSHAAAAPPPPSGAELVALARARGPDAVAAIVARYHRDAPTDVILDERELNSLGYRYLGERRLQDALTAFRLVIQSHPRSANAYDSYGDGLIQAADTAGAVDAYRRAIELAPEDSALDAASRDDLVKSERMRIAALTGRGAR